LAQAAMPADRKRRRLDDLRFALREGLFREA
jgi:hypothetical protein